MESVPMSPCFGFMMRPKISSKKMFCERTTDSLGLSNQILALTNLCINYLKLSPSLIV